MLDEREILLEVGSNETEPRPDDRLDGRLVNPLALDEAGDDFYEFLEIDEEAHAPAEAMQSRISTPLNGSCLLMGGSV